MADPEQVRRSKEIVAKVVLEMDDADVLDYAADVLVHYDEYLFGQPLRAVELRELASGIRRGDYPRSG